MIILRNWKKVKKRDCLGGECVCPCVCVLRFNPSKLSALPASRGKYIYSPDRKDSADERLVGVVSAESYVTSLHVVAATNLVLGTALSPPPSLSKMRYRGEKKKCEMTKLNRRFYILNPRWIFRPSPGAEGLTATPRAARCSTMCMGCIYPDAKRIFLTSVTLKWTAASCQQ